jgi:hypothetical protein
MKAQSRLLILCFVALSLSSHSSFGQTQTQTPPPTPGGISGTPSSPGGAPTPDWIRRTEAYNRGLEAEMRRRTLNSRKPGAVLPIVLTEEELTADERKVLTPTPEDLKANAEFLRQAGTGVFRLMRVDKEKHGKVVSADSMAVAGDVLLVGGGAQYSFTKKNHNADKWSDITWEDDRFLAGVGGQAVGVLVNLGDVSLANVNLESTGLEYLIRFVPAATEGAAEQQFQQLEKGVQENGFSYGLSASWKLDTSYALRSINYGRADVLVAFRVVRQDPNGSLIVLWKKLKSFTTPNLKKEPKK